MTGVLVRRGRFGHKHGQREDDVETQEKTVTCKPGNGAWGRSSLKALIKNQLCPHLGTELAASTTVREHISVVSASSLWYFVMAAHAD